MQPSGSEVTPSSFATLARIRVRRALRVVSLIRTDTPNEEAAITTRRLTNIVAEWPTGTALSIDVAARSIGTVGITFTASGPVSDSWITDIRWALREIAVLAPATPSSHRGAATLLELRPRRETDRAMHWDRPDTTQNHQLLEGLYHSRGFLPD